jgi:hypothetical protein
MALPLDVSHVSVSSSLVGEYDALAYHCQEVGIDGSSWVDPLLRKVASLAIASDLLHSTNKGLVSYHEVNALLSLAMRPKAKTRRKTAA